MAISKIKLPDNSVQEIRDSRITGVDTTPTSGSTNVITSGGVYDANYAGSTSNGGPANQAVGIPFVTLDSTSTSTVFKATVPGVTSLRDGVCFIVDNNVVSSASGCTFEINNLGAKRLYMTNAAATRVTTQFAKGNTWMLVYNSKRYSDGCWDLVYLFNTNSTYSLNRVYGAGMLASRTVYRYQLVFTVDESHVTPINANSNATGTSKTIHTDWEFDPFGRIYFYNTTTTVSAGGSIGTLYYIIDTPNDLRYTFNLSTSVNPLSTDYGPVYLMIDINSSTGMATLHSTAPLTQTLPSTNDGIYYLLLGMAGTTKYSCSLRNEHPIYYHNGTNLCQLLSPEVRNSLPTVTVTDVTVGGTSVVSNGTAVIPAIPSSPGTLNTTATTAQTTSASEALSGTISLHKVAKTGTYSDLIGKPTIDSSPTNNSSNLVSSGGVYNALSSAVFLGDVVETI